MPLTDTAIKALKAHTKRYSVTDEKGLVLEVFPTGGILFNVTSAAALRIDWPFYGTTVDTSFEAALAVPEEFNATTAK